MAEDTTKTTEPEVKATESKTTDTGKETETKTTDTGGDGKQPINIKITMPEFDKDKSYSGAELGMVMGTLESTINTSMQQLLEQNKSTQEQQFNELTRKATVIAEIKANESVLASVKAGGGDAWEKLETSTLEMLFGVANSSPGAKEGKESTSSVKSSGLPFVGNGASGVTVSDMGSAISAGFDKAFKESK